MAGLFSKGQKIVGGKYLVKRRDGTVPEWPWFVLGGRDPMAPWALRFYAILAFIMRKDWQYVKDVWKLAGEFAQYRWHTGSGDPDGPRHRQDDPETVAQMQCHRGA